MPRQKNEPGRASSAPQTSQFEGAVCILRPGQRLRPGMLCPRCGEAELEYNGLLNLVCPKCGLTDAGAST